MYSFIQITWWLHMQFLIDAFRKEYVNSMIEFPVWV